MNKKQAVVIGAGIGGIASALRARKKGYKVDVYEAANSPGGKLSSFQINGYRFDRGPSLFTMPQYVDELFELFGENPKAHFKYTKQEIVCHYFWDDKTTLKAWSDPKKFAKETASTFNIDPKQILNYLNTGKLKYELAGRTFLEKDLHKKNTWLNQSILPAVGNIHKLDLFSTMAQVNQRAFSHPKLVQLFNRFATYNGSDPYLAPGILTMIPAFEHLFGTYLPDNGMYEITTSLVNFAKKLGVNFHYNQKIVEVVPCPNKKSISHLISKNGNQIKADLFINNADVHKFYNHLLTKGKKPNKILNQERSTSALIFYWGIKKSFTNLGLHNIFFSNNYQNEFLTLRKGDIADDFTVYVNITSKVVQNECPKGHENWFVMVNAPYENGQNWKDIKQRIKQQTIKKLSAILGENLAPLIQTEKIWTPPEIDQDTGSHLGALYGTSSNNKWAAFLRHRNKSKAFSNLYFVGGSVHPGGGVPLALLSAKIASEDF